MAVKRWTGSTWEIYAGADTSPGFAATDGRAGRRTWVGANTPTAPTDGDIWIDQDTATNSIPASAFDAKGDLMVGTGPDTYIRQAVGTDGQVLVADSTQADGVVWSHTPSRQGLVNIVPTSVSVGSGSASVGANGAVTFTSVSSLSLTGAFSATYTNYKIIGYATRVPSTSGTIDFKLRNAGTDSSASYYGGIREFDTNASTASWSNGVATTDRQIIGYFGGTIPMSFTMEITNPFNAYMSQWNGLFNGIIQGARFNGGIFSGVHLPTSSYDGFSLIPTDAMTGVIRVYGYNNGA
jgi:hypothetical protein